MRPLRTTGIDPLHCPLCGVEMRLIASMTAAVTVRDIFSHLGEPPLTPRLAPARGTPLGEAPT